MKTNDLTTSMLSKAGLITKCLTLVLAALALSTASVGAAQAVPFKGNAVGAIVSTTPGPEGVLLKTYAEGYATHLGRFTRDEVLLLNPLTGAIAGSIVFTAANGDKLSGLVAAQFISPTNVIGTITFTDGTGRFKNATGLADAIVSTADGVHFSVEFEGNLSSVGANID